MGGSGRFQGRFARAIRLRDWQRIWATGRGAAVLAGLATVLAVAAVQLVGLPLVDRLGLMLFDTYQQAAPRAYQDAPVRVVDIDEESIRRLGQWPWPRTDIARLTKALTDAGASAIAFDIVFSEADRTSPPRIAKRMARDGENLPGLLAMERLPDNDATLATSFAHAPVVGGYFLLNGGAGGGAGGGGGGGGGGRAATVSPRAGMAVAGAPPIAVPQYAGAIQPLPQLQAASAGDGFVSLSGDADGIVRRAPMLAMDNGQLLPSLSLDALRVAQGAGSIIVKTSNGSGEHGGVAGEVVSVKVGALEAPLTADGALWLHYTKAQPARVIPAWKILTGAFTPDQMKQAFAGRIVFVGAGAIGLRDLVSTPVQGRDLGVIVHAQAAEQIILGHFLTRPDWAPGLERVLLLLLGLGMVLALPRLGAARGAVLGLALVAATLWGSWHAFVADHFLLDPTYPVLGLGLAYVVETAITYYREERARTHIHKAFDRYLSPEMVRRIADDPGSLDLGGEEREMTVLFCDIRGFSRISEGLGPKQLIAFLIAFLTPMCDILLARRATIDKFIGDAIVAFWNAPLDDPDQYENAARGALAMVARLHSLNREMPGAAGQPWPGEVKIGIGLNAGLCCVGNMGSAQRLSYTLIGDTVNLSSRLEGLTKTYGVPIAIGHALAARLPGFATLELDRIRVVGRDAPETVYALLGDESLAAQPGYAALVASQGAMLAALRAQDWVAARAALNALEGHAAHFGLATLVTLYRQRLDALSASPVASDWDGVFQATEK